MKHECEDCGVKFNEGHVADDGEYCEPCYEAICVKSALDAGIPLSVIEGRTKLRDHFSQEYIDSQTKTLKKV